MCSYLQYKPVFFLLYDNSVIVYNLSLLQHEKRSVFGVCFTMFKLVCKYSILKTVFFICEDKKHVLLALGRLLYVCLSRMFTN